MFCFATRQFIAFFACLEVRFLQVANLVCGRSEGPQSALHVEMCAVQHLRLPFHIGTDEAYGLSAVQT